MARKPKAKRPVVLACGCSAEVHCYEGLVLAENAHKALMETIRERFAREPAARRVVRGAYYLHRGVLVHPWTWEAFQIGSWSGEPGGLEFLGRDSGTRKSDIEDWCSRCDRFEAHEYGRKVCRKCWSAQRRGQKVRAKARVASARENAPTSVAA